MLKRAVVLSAFASPKVTTPGPETCIQLVVSGGGEFDWLSMAVAASCRTRLVLFRKTVEVAGLVIEALGGNTGTIHISESFTLVASLVPTA